MSYERYPWWSYIKQICKRYPQGVITDAERAAVAAAVEETKKLPDGENRIRLIIMVLWKQTHTIMGASMKLYISEGTAKIWHRQFIYLVAEKLGIYSPQSHNDNV